MQEYVAAIKLLNTVITGRQPLAFTDQTSPLAKQLCFGVLRDYYSLTYFRDALLDKKLPAKHADLNVLLLCGLYSIYALNRPDYASVNATVETTHLIGKSWAKGMVNAVLRNFQRRGRDIAKDMTAEASANHPVWLAQALNEAWPDFADQILEANNQHAPMTLRVNLRKTAMPDYQRLLAENAITSKFINVVPAALQLDTALPVSALPGFSAGLVSVQDEASQLVAPLLDVKPGEFVLDACAAPGGKTCHLLELEPGINLTAMDKDSRRLKQLEHNLARLGLRCHIETADFLQYAGARKFDKILLDAPCSATGIIRRHPDIKLLRDRNDIDKLVATQSRLLSTAWNHLEIGGELLYATCSVLPQENEQVVRRFVDAQDDAVVLPLNILQGIKRDIGRQLFPVANGHDGFYIGHLKKVSQ